MNKYQKALNSLSAIVSLTIKEPKDAVYLIEVAYLQELVDKATPKKPMKIKTDYMEAYVCPNCRHSFEGFSYCRFCGQRLQRFEVESEDE